LRYKIEETTGLPYTETSPGMLAFTVAIALVVGIALLVLGKRGRQTWLTVWSAGLIICSIAYLIWHFSVG